MNIDQFHIKESNNAEKESKYYTIFGKHDYLDDDQNPRLDKESQQAFAKVIINNNKSRFFIKTGTYGKIYNPIGLYSENTHSKFLNRAGKPAWNFKEVNSRVFGMYVSFLRTKNLAWLNNAEREMS